MKRFFFLTVWVAAIGILPVQANKMLYLYLNSGYAPAYLTAEIDSLTFDESYERMYVHTASTVREYLVTEVDSLVLADPIGQVQVTWNDAVARAINPLVTVGVDVSVDGTDVVVNSVSDSKELIYTLQGSSSDGMFKIYSEKKYVLQLNGLSLTNADGPALNCQSKKSCAVVLIEGTQNYLADGAGYSTSSAEGEDQKAALFAEGQILFSGSGSLTVSGNNNHAICSDDYLLFEEGLGAVTVNNAANDGLHGKEYTEIRGGMLTITASGDAVDAGGSLLISGGTMDVTVLNDVIKREALKADTAIYINGGNLVVKNTSNAGKCIKTEGAITINAGTMKLTNTGSYYLESGDLSTSSAIKSDSLIVISGGDITIVNSSAAGKGINSDGIVRMTGGTVTGTISGAGVEFTNTDNEKDVSSSKCISSDGAMYLLGGTVTSTSSGIAGKGITSKDMMTIGSTTAGPSLNITTTGAKLTVSGSSSGGWNTGRPGGGGGDMDNSEGSSPKAIKSIGDMVVNNGQIVVKTSQDGGEGLESKATMTINGGIIEATTYDDALNAATDITVNGGYVYAYASNNDGIDSNGTLHFNGGVTISSGTTNPEGAFDCDNNTFAITGGILIGTGGSNSTPRNGTQKYVTYSGVSLTSGQIMRISSSNSTTGTDNILVYKAPRTISSATVIMSAEELKSGTTYYLLTGASVTSGTETFRGYYENVTATGGSSKGSCSAR